VPALDDDRPLSREIAAIARMIASHELENVVDELVK
jgi:histidine ammonia-lyase